VLVDEDLPVRFDQVFRMSTVTEKYENLFEGLALNKSLAQAEASLHRIEELYRKFQRMGDRTGLRFARQTAMRARHNAVTLSQDSNLTLQKKTEQREIAEWFTIWLQTPDLFGQWLELRKATPDFKETFKGSFGAASDTTEDEGQANRGD
jgi:hypothetical protein